MTGPLAFLAGPGASGASGAQAAPVPGAALPAAGLPEGPEGMASAFAALIGAPPGGKGGEPQASDLSAEELQALLASLTEEEAPPPGLAVAEGLVLPLAAQLPAAALETAAIAITGKGQPALPIAASALPAAAPIAAGGLPGAAPVIATPAVPGASTAPAAPPLPRAEAVAAQVVPGAGLALPAQSAAQAAAATQVVAPAVARGAATDTDDIAPHAPAATAARPAPAAMSGAPAMPMLSAPGAGAQALEMPEGSLPAPRTEPAPGQVKDTAPPAAPPSQPAAPALAPVAPGFIEAERLADGPRGIAESAATGPGAAEPASSPRVAAGAGAVPGAPGQSSTAETARQIGATLAESAKANGDGSVELRLHPRELGSVRMVMMPGDGSITVALAAERGDTLDLMRRHIDLLAEAFRQIGYRDASFSFARQNPQRDAPAPGDRDGEAAIAPAVAPEAPAATSAPRRPGAALDLRV